MKTMAQLAGGAVGAVMLCATPAHAANWVYVITGIPKTDLYYDADSIKRTGNIVTAWEMRDHSRDNTVKFRSAKALKRYDCAERTMATITATYYNPNGTNFTDNWKNYEQKMEPVVPETVGEAVLEAVCAASKG